MPATEIVCDANIALKWFHHEGEQEVEPVRQLLDRHRDRQVVLYILDLTFYEVGNALLRGRSRVTAKQAAIVLAALREICPAISPTDADWALASELTIEHDLTLYDAAYAAVAIRRDARLVTLDRALLAAGLGTQPAELLAQLDFTQVGE